ncbi:putative nuclease HARBI1 [Clarias gariepinus]|uniref:putative nuclease HARBI1 n=1 Tax=Clarias gariepinus TaxID=13013 RepID=UPI00234DAD79|nr:putative nuclease HARBI1 [Clarias gariepinus]
MEVVEEGYGLSKPSVWRCVLAVTNALLRHAGDWIHLPATRQEVQEVHQGCHAIAGIPRVLGLVDGTLIPIFTPSVLDQAYMSRKGYAAINVQVVVDHRDLINDLVAKWPGSTHDSFVWANSAVGEQAERVEFGQSMFLGDSGYPLRTAFNVAHIHTRNIVERAIGLWKLRFRCLHKSAGGLRIKPYRCCAVMVKTAMLHNMALRGNTPLPEEEEEANEEEDAEVDVKVFNPSQRAALHAAGVEARQQLIENVFV